jgi:hypothetical protein
MVFDAAAPFPHGHGLGRAQDAACSEHERWLGIGTLKETTRRCEMLHRSTSAPQARPVGIVRHVSSC